MSLAPNINSENPAYAFDNSWSKIRQFVSTLNIYVSDKFLKCEALDFWDWGSERETLEEIMWLIWGSKPWPFVFHQFKTHMKVLHKSNSNVQ